MSEHTDQQRENLPAATGWHHGISLFFSALVCVLYFTSADGFFESFKQSDKVPESLKHAWMTSITDFSETWHFYVFFLMVTPASLMLLTINHVSMTQRLSALETGKKAKPPACLPENVLTAFSIATGVWKMTVSGGELVLLLTRLFGATRINKTSGFGASVTLTALAGLGDFMAQKYNFTGDECFIPIKNMALRKALAVFFALGYSLGSMALYGDTVDRVFKKIGWLDYRLSEVPDLKYNIPANATHALFLLVFGYQTVKQYYPRFLNMLTPTAETSVAPPTIPNEQTQLIQANPISANIANEKKFTIANRFQMKDLVPASYKATAIYFSLLEISRLFLDLKEMNVGKKTYVVVIGALQLMLGTPPQLTYYMTTDEQLQAQQADPESAGIKGITIKINTLFCNKKTDENTAVTLTQEEGGTEMHTASSPLH